MTTKHIAGLNWTQPQDVQEAAIAALKVDIGNDLSPLMMQNLSKAQWENAAEVLASLEPSRVAPYAPRLLEWLKDRNWPGACRIFEFFLQMQKYELFPYLDHAISQAREEADEDWLDALLRLRNEVSGRAV